MKYRKGWIVVNGVPTFVRTWGGWIEDDLNSEVLLFITGNPGVTDFYIKFLSLLNMFLNIPVWVLCHAGHQLPHKSLSLRMPSIRKNGGLYTLKGQIEHKRSFINKYIPSPKRFYLMGHSIGGKISVELMKDKDIADRVIKSILIFPTLENIKKTINGWLFCNITYRIVPVLIFLAWVFCKLPYRVRYCLFYTMYILRMNRELCCIHGLLKLFEPKAVRGAIHLAIDEMAVIKELDHEVYEKYRDKLMIYYGSYDRWTEPHHYANMKNAHPDVNAEVLDSKFKHAFIFKKSYEMADFLVNKIKGN